MKKILFILACLLHSTLSTAQTEKGIYVYGVDFSHAKVYAAQETTEQFVQAFEGINLLLIYDPSKYNFSQMSGRNVEVDIAPIMKVNASCDYSNLKSYNKSYEEPDYADIVKKYDLQQPEGTGIVLVAKILDKPAAMADYKLILFDIATREILSTKDVYGIAGGFGLRNYWARSVYNIITTVRF